MQRLTREQYQAFREGAEVIEQDAHGDKVLRLSNGTFFKLFRIKSVFSSARLVPYSVQFARNAKKLAEMNIPTVVIKSCFRLPEIERTAVHYEPLPGETGRQMLTGANPIEREQFLKKIATFFVRLHKKGIYFRSLHLGNIVVQPNGDLGLIDIADMRCYRRSLSKAKRLRNLRHMSRYKDDVGYLLGSDTFCRVYADLTDLAAEQIRSVMASVKGR